MPYAAFYPDTTVLTKPSVEALQKLADATPPPPNLTIFEYPFASIEPLSVFPNLEVLKIQSTGALRTLTGIGALTKLKQVVISTPPTWDGTKKKVEVDSFAPLADVKSLERLILLGVRPADLDLAPIMRMTHLKDFDIGGVPEFTIEHYARLAAALPTTEGRGLVPYVEIKGVGFCKKCKGQQVLLNGAPHRGRKWVCPKCDAKKLAEHVQAWETAKAKTD
jgi:hypothetical protein